MERYKEQDLHYLWIIIMVLFFLAPSKFFGQTRSINVTSSNGKSTITVKNGNNKYKIQYEGEVSLSDDDRDITAISRGGFIELSKTAFGSSRKVKIEADGNGRLIRKYYVGRSEKTFDPEGRKWLAEVLPEIVRNTPLGASSRVDRFYSKGGVEAVLGEIERIESDFVGEKYYDLLMDKDLSDNKLAKVVESVGNNLESDHYIASILRENSKTILSTEESVAAYLKTAGNLDSDHYKAEVLNEAIEDADISDVQMQALFSVAKSMDSDHYQAEVLKTAMDEKELNAENLGVLVEATHGIESDHYRSEVLREALTRENLVRPVKKKILDALVGLDSDHYLNEVLRELADEKMEEADIIDVLEIVQNSIDSDHYKQEVLQELLDNQDFSDESFPTLLETVESIDSDHYFLEVIKQVENEQDLSEKELISIINLIEKVDSDHYLTEALMHIAGEVEDSSERVKAAYREAAKKISSETYYGRALRAIE